MSKQQLKRHIGNLNIMLSSLEAERAQLQSDIEVIEEEKQNYINGDILWSTNKTPYPDLIVRSGQTYRIGQRLYRFNKIVIERGGHLIIRGSSPSWCVLHSENEVLMHGKITASHLPTSSILIDFEAPSGYYLSHRFLNRARGGNGGNGGPAAHARSSQSPGGSGALGTDTYGGGGGGGASCHTARRQRNPRSVPGGDARQYQGGAPGLIGNSSGGRGGSGGRPSRFINGALLYIHGTSFDGAGGQIVLTGKNGAAGEAGGAGRRQRNGWYSVGGGGGGGGSPGGDGGVLYVESPNISAYPNITLSGGRGGQGAAGGRNGGQTGTAGDPGEDGYAQWN